MLQARETIAQVNAQALPWLGDEDRAAAVSRLNAAAGVEDSEEARWGSDVERVDIDSFRSEIGAAPAEAPPRKRRER